MIRQKVQGVARMGWLLSMVVAAACAVAFALHPLEPGLGRRRLLGGVDGAADGDPAVRAGADADIVAAGPVDQGVAAFGAGRRVMGEPGGGPGGAGRRGLRGGGGTLAEINIVPLVDVVLVLLIIFMVITPMLHKGVSVDMASATNVDKMQAADKDDAIIVAVTRDGKTFLGNNQLSLDQISDDILDGILAQDAAARVACETLVTTARAMGAGERQPTAYGRGPAVRRGNIEYIGHPSG